uniref:Uncharacterized protein n=1 Tax=Planktothrix agardhii TaxID=1160 RepID=A0A1J1JLQ1_PLAAG|nr:protein of unknown function [Planktothrix agardhii]
METLIERIDPDQQILEITPYSLGKLIDWKRKTIMSVCNNEELTPYSLGKLIDWKHQSNQASSISVWLPTR